MHRTAKEVGLKKFSNLREIGILRQKFRENETSSYPHNMSREVEENSSMDHCREGNRSNENSESNRQIELIEAQQLSQKKNSWRHFSSKESFDTNMAGTIMGKRKFNEEKLDNIEAYLSDDVKTKRAKFDSICSADFATTEPSCFVLTDVSNPSQIISTVTKWQA